MVWPVLLKKWIKQVSSYWIFSKDIGFQLEFTFYHISIILLNCQDMSEHFPRILVFSKILLFITSVYSYWTAKIWVLDITVFSPSVRIVGISFSVENLLIFTDFYKMKGILSFNKICPRFSSKFVNSYWQDNQNSNLSCQWDV